MDDQTFVARRRDLSDRLAAILEALFVGLGSWRDADVDAFLEQAVPALQGTQEALAQLTAVYVATQAAEAFDTDAPVPDLDWGSFTGLRSGVTPGEVYARPFVTVRTALANGKTLDEAVQLGSQRLGQVVEMDLQQTYAEASRASLKALPERARPRFWARVLKGVSDCGLCVVASTQRYWIEDLNPIHPHCDCVVKPLSAKTDPGQVIAPQLLEQVHDAIQDMTGTVDRGARAPDYRKYLTQMVDRHGEVGPMLHRIGDNFDGPRDVL